MAKLTRAEAISASNAIISNNEILKTYDLEFKVDGTSGKGESLANNLAEFYINVVSELMEIEV